ncbi:MAG TPA: hypothetical protein VG347_01295 [Verrucomicrobiae bacterium]|nr:hypothetical protein [Verrucomicrobiae bacterium]
MSLPPTQFEDSRRRQAGGHTLLEMMFVMGILVTVVMALMAAHLMGMREQQWVESKSGASDTSRRLLNQLPVDIRSSKMWFVGSMSGSTFTIITNSSQGSALMLYDTTNGSGYVAYYFDLSGAGNSDGHLLRFTSTSTNPVIVASNLVNWLGGGYTFNVEDYNGSAATNDANSKSYKCIIHINLQFCQFEYPLTQVGTNGLYDYYKIEFKVTPHLPE